MSGDGQTVVLLGDYDYEYFREVSLREGLESQGVIVKECRYREEPLFIGVKKLVLLPYFYALILQRLWQLSGETDIDAILVTKFNVLVLPVAALGAWWLDAVLIYDLFVSLYRLLVAGNFTDPAEVVELLDSVLLLLIIVEVHRTLVAYARGKPVLRTVVSAAIIAVSRRVISFRLEDYGTGDEALLAAVSLGVLVLTLTVGYFLLDRVSVPGRLEL